MEKFKVGDKVISLSWANKYGVLTIERLPHQRILPDERSGEAEQFFYLSKDGKFLAYHTEEMFRKLTPLEELL